MHSEELNKRFVIGPLYWTVLAAITPAVLILSRPWNWELPVYSRIAGIVALPLLFSIPAYLIVYLVHRVFFARSVKGNEICGLIAAVSLLAAGAVASFLIPSLMEYRDVVLDALGVMAYATYEIVSGIAVKGTARKSPGSVCK
jgi:hypothetical protein